MRPRLRYVVGTAVLVLVCLGAIEGVRLLGAYRDLTSARTTFTTLQNTLLNADTLSTITEADVARTRSRMLDARQRLHAAAGVVGDDLLLAVGAHLPLLGRQARAARTLAAIGPALGDAGVEAAGILETLRQMRDQQGTPLLERIVPALLSTQPAVDRIDQLLATVHRLRDPLDTGGLAGPLAGAWTTLDRELPRADEALAAYRDAVAALPVALGYNGARTYLVLARDSSELLGSGGFDLAFGLLTVDHGRLTQVTFYDTGRLLPGDWPPKDREHYLNPPPALATYLLGDWPMSIGDASWWLDFPASAQQAIQLYHVNLGDQTLIAGVIGIDSYTLEALLRVEGPLTIDNFGITVTADDVIRQELVITNPANDVWVNGIDPKEFGVQLGTQTFQRLLQLPSSQWSQMARTVQDLVRHRDVAIYDTDASIEQLIDKFGGSGRVDAANGSDFVMVADASVGPSKMNLVVQSSLALDVALQDDGSATDTLTLSYSSPFAEWAQRDPELARVFETPAGFFGDYIRVLAPADADLLGITHDGKAPPQTEPVTSEAGHNEFATYMALGKNHSATIAVRSHVPRVLSTSGGTREYRLRLMKQPGTRGGGASVTVHPPAGWLVAAARLDGHDVNATGGVITTDLTQDRTLTLVLRQRR